MRFKMDEFVVILRLHIKATPIYDVLELTDFAMYRRTGVNLEVFFH